MSWTKLYKLQSDNATNLIISRVDCDDPGSLQFCVSLSPLIPAFPALVYYRGFDPPRIWAPKVQYFEGGWYEGGFDAVFLKHFVNAELEGELCGKESFGACGDGERRRIDKFVEGGREEMDRRFEEVVKGIEVEMARKITSLAKFDGAWGEEEEEELWGMEVEVKLMLIAREIIDSETGNQ
ncbi:hypothetical protein TrRE_jg13198 [Triparma retinervis]|uniref:Uncharacterized protein n=1 Tax=Triparma retinervis TaxID=2557542 RepID=A0A9W6ZLT6_9STRA|nr:hypothetical protein TrRE_jg13198 [Triparma retinervis]